MYNYATVIDMLRSGCHYICKFWFENDTLMQVRQCHLFGIWYVFIADTLFSSFFDYAHDKIYVDIYLKILGCILVLYTSYLII